MVLIVRVRPPRLAKFIEAGVKMALPMGLRDTLKAVSDARHLERVAEVTRVQRKRWTGRTRIHVLIYTGEETQWQGPRRDYVDTEIPAGRIVEPGTRLVVKHISGTGTNPWRVLWDRPEPAPPARGVTPPS
jgi:hypothetical protein